ncbi:MAG: twin-arginine translocase subunit TatC [Synergistaceae bacterium]|nr:twin-arginine translocase subunit TatC [Synergistaceae bacterium]
MNGGKAPLISHLQELRRAVQICAGSVIAAFVVVWCFASDALVGWIVAPIKAKGIEIIYTAMSEAFTTKIKVSFTASVIIASPVIIWQMWSFIRPALYPGEKRAFKLVFAAALGLFLAGVVFCYEAVYMFAVDFFLVAGDNLATPMLSLDKYVGFLFGFILPFGMAFQLPVFLYMTTRLGWTNYDMLASKRKYVVLAVFTLAAILTPPDVISQIALGVPMMILYEIGVQVCRFADK